MIEAPQMERLERWTILGDGLSYTIVVVPDTDPLSVIEILKICRCVSAVITMFDAITGEFLGMAYAGIGRNELETIRYGRRKGDANIYAF